MCVLAGKDGREGADQPSSAIHPHFSGEALPLAMFAEGVFGKVSLTGQRGHVIQALVPLLEVVDIRH